MAVDPIPSAHGLVSVKNKAPAPIQISAEQLLREAHERKDILYRPPKKIVPGTEGDEQKLLKRKHFEDLVRRFHKQPANYFRYAKWEETIGEVSRARSIFERAVTGCDSREPSLWLRYVSFELRCKNINSARNILLRAISVLPKVDALWFKLLHLEVALGNLDGARSCFLQWLRWEPGEHAYFAYIKFESKNQNKEAVRWAFTQLLQLYCTADNWCKFAESQQAVESFEETLKIYQKAMQVLRPEEKPIRFYRAYIRFLARFQQAEVARSLLRDALEAETVPKKRKSLLELFIAFERQWGDPQDIEKLLILKRSELLEERLSAAPTNYDAWFQLAELFSQYEKLSDAAAVYERACNTAIPPVSSERRLWKRYIFLWLERAAFLEAKVGDIDAADSVYRDVLKCIPHEKFTFGKVWLQYAKFLIRTTGTLDIARRLLGQAIGKCPKRSLFRGYISLERKADSRTRVRTLYQKYIDWGLGKQLDAWIEWATYEAEIGDLDRSFAIFEMAIRPEFLETNEFCWKAYVDHCIRFSTDPELVRSLYERLLQLTQHVKVYLSYASFEAESGEEQRCRTIFRRGYDALDDASLEQERMLLIEAWKEFDSNQKCPLYDAQELEPTIEIDSDGVEKFIWKEQKEPKDLTCRLLEMAREWKKV